MVKHWGSVVVFLLALGCRHAPVVHVKDPGPAQVDASWTLVEDKAHGVSLFAPSGWKNGSGLTMDTSTVMTNSGMGDDPAMSDPNNPVGRIMGQMEQAGRLDEAKEMAKLAAKGMYLHCVDGSRPIPGEERTRFYLKKKVGDGPADLDSAMLEERQWIHGADISDVKLPIGPAKRLISETTTRGGDKVNQVSYVIVDGNDVYCLRFVSTNNPGAVLAIHEAVAHTLRIKPSAVK